jgi:hypothetical protein
LVLPSSLATVNYFIEAGWQQLDASNTPQLIALITQLCEVQYIGTPENAQAWARTEDIAHVDQYPVHLLFTMPSDKPPMRDTTSLEMLHYVPPPRMGELAAIYNKDNPLDAHTSGLYEYDVLPKEARALYLQLSEALKNLALPSSSWIVHNKLMPLLMVE